MSRDARLTLRACPDCRSHIRPDAACPFCADRGSGPWMGRLGRAGALALGLVSLGCGVRAETTPAADAGAAPPTDAAPPVKPAPKPSPEPPDVPLYGVPPMD